MNQSPLSVTPEKIRTALSYLSPDLPREDWAKVGMAIKQGLNGEGFDLFDVWSQGGQSYNRNDTRDTWKSINGNGRITIATLFYLAGQNGWKSHDEPNAHPETGAEWAERERQRQARAEQEAAERARKQAEAAKKSVVLWEAATLALADHPYLARKGVMPTETLCEITATQAATILGYAPKSDDEPLTGRLLVAPVEIDDRISTVELIDEAGRKSAVAGGAKSGGYWMAQLLPDGEDSGLVLVIGEGVATTLSAREATGHLAVAALSAGNLLKVAQTLRHRYPAAQLIILADLGNGQVKAEEAARETSAILALPNFTGLNATATDNDFNDLHRIAGLETVRQQIEEEAACFQKKQERSRLHKHQLYDNNGILCKKKQGSREAGTSKRKNTVDFDSPTVGFPHVTETGRKRATIANLRYLFQSYRIELSYNELLKKQTIRFNNANDRGHGDLIDNAGVAHIRSLLALNGLPASSLDLLPALFAEKATNPVLGWIESKSWDRSDRLGALADTLSVDSSDLRYRDLALRTWLLQCVAAADGARRTLNSDALPKYELAFILQGGQGAKKTSWFKRLVPKHLSAYIIDGAHLDPADKETVRTCISSWICELGELDSTFRRADISRLKAFLSKQTDTLRLPYDRAESQFGRRTSFCGSVNPEQFLNDSTGSRRFLPLQVTACDSLHTIDMQQLWAQVLSYYLDGEQWWCDATLEEMLKERHERHSETTPVDELIAEAFHVEKVDRDFGHRHYTATRLLIECGIKEPKAQQASIANAYLKKMGFRQVQADGVRGYWLERRSFKT